MRYVAGTLTFLMLILSGCSNSSINTLTELSNPAIYGSSSFSDVTNEVPASLADKPGTFAAVEEKQAEGIFNLFWRASDIHPLSELKILLCYALFYENNSEIARMVGSSRTPKNRTLCDSFTWLEINSSGVTSTIDMNMIKLTGASWFSVDRTVGEEKDAEALKKAMADSRRTFNKVILQTAGKRANGAYFFKFKGAKRIVRYPEYIRLTFVSDNPIVFNTDTKITLRFPSNFGQMLYEDYSACLKKHEENQVEALTCGDLNQFVSQKRYWGTIEDISAGATP